MSHRPPSERLRRHAMLDNQPMKRAPGHPRKLSSLGDVSVRLPQVPDQGIALEGINHPGLRAGEALGVIHLQPGALDVEWQVIHLDLTALGQDDASLDGVFQLTQVSRPGVSPQALDRLGGDPFHPLVHLGLGLSEKVRPQGGDVLGPLPQWRQGDGERVEPVKEISLSAGWFVIAAPTLSP